MRGTHFTTLSHTLRTPPSAADAAAGLPPKPSTVLLPEEALHLLSRGSLALYSSAAPPPALDVSPQASLVEHQLLAPELAARKLTVQEATALWASEVSGGRWEVYVGLKRMGYVVQRAPRHLPKELRPAPDVGRAARAQAEQARRSWPGAAWAGLTGVFGRLWSAWTGVLSRFSGLLAGAFRRGSRAPAPVLPSYGAVDDEWTTLLSQRSVLPDEEWSYSESSPSGSGHRRSPLHDSDAPPPDRRPAARIFSRLRIIPNSSSPAPSPKPTPSPAPTADNEPAGPYDIFFHVWKPSSAYKKSNPPPPDFYVSVVECVSLRCPPNARSRLLTGLSVFPLPQGSHLASPDHRRPPGYPRPDARAARAGRPRRPDRVPLLPSRLLARPGAVLAVPRPLPLVLVPRAGRQRGERCAARRRPQPDAVPQAGRQERRHRRRQGRRRQLDAVWPGRLRPDGDPMSPRPVLDDALVRGGCGRVCLDSGCARSSRGTGEEGRIEGREGSCGGRSATRREAPPAAATREGRSEGPSRYDALRCESLMEEEEQACTCRQPSVPVPAKGGGRREDSRAADENVRPFLPPS